jgi:small redox-active disulfide protein 2
MLIQILGTGCAKCNQLKENAEVAVKDLGKDAQIEKVEDIMQITSFGVMSTPGLVVDGQVKVTGKVPSVEEIKGMLE